jgi:hypothetical protein
MALSISVAVVCDDVREEVGNKLTLVGLYNDAITFQPGQGPFGLPKLASVFVLRGLRGVAQLQVRHTMTVAPAGADTSRLAQNEPTLIVERPPEARALDEQSLIRFAMPLVFPSSPSILRAALWVQTDTGETYEYVREVQALRLIPGGAPPIGSSLPPGSRPFN